MVTIHMTRDSVCMADDVDAPHDQIFELPASATLLDLGRRIASSSYLPMQSDTWGWIIRAGEAAVVIRPRLMFLRRADRLLGDPASVILENNASLFAAQSREDRQRYTTPRGGH